MKKTYYILLCSVAFLLISGCSKQKEQIDLSGKWVADGTQYKEILKIENDKPIHAKENFDPFYLNIDKEGKYIFEFDGNIEKGHYEINDVLEIVFISEDISDVPWRCDFKEKNKLKCNLYAEEFVKK